MLLSQLFGLSALRKLIHLVSGRTKIQDQAVSPYLLPLNTFTYRVTSQARNMPSRE